jgi:outer membrane lipoprotein-sorting protein
LGQTTVSRNMKKTEPHKRRILAQAVPERKDMTQYLKFKSAGELKTAWLFAALVILGWVFSLSVYAGQQSLTAAEIIKRANDAVFFAGKDAVCTLRIEERDDEIPEGSLILRLLRFNGLNDGSQKFYVYFKEPDMVSGIRYLAWKFPDKEDERWIYLPLLEFVQKIPRQNKREQFLKLHFTFEDITGRKLDDDNYELIDSDAGHYQIKSWPKEYQQTEFAYYYIWIRQKDFIPVKIEFVDKDDNLVRLIETLEVKTIEGYPTITKALIKDVAGYGEATLFFENVHYNVGLTEDVFTQEALKVVPDRWINGESDKYSK